MLETDIHARRERCDAKDEGHLSTDDAKACVLDTALGGHSASSSIPTCSAKHGSGHHGDMSNVAAISPHSATSSSIPSCSAKHGSGHHGDMSNVAAISPHSAVS